MVAEILVCPLSQIEAVAHQQGVKSMVTLLSQGVDVARPSAVAHEQHLHLTVSDIVLPMDGQIVPAARHVEDFLDFARAWDQQAPLLIHCYAGVSRSTAAAFIAVCALRPEQAETAIAERLRSVSATATPNRQLVALADHALGREGRMIEAVAAIGRGATCYEGAAFALPLD